MSSNSPLGAADNLSQILMDLAATIDSRAGADPTQSYTAKLLDAGPILCAKKLGEEATELVLAVAAESPGSVASEAGDLIYHILVALRSRGVSLDAVADDLAGRRHQSGLEEKAGRSPAS